MTKSQKHVHYGVKFFSTWLPLVFISFCLIGLVYVAAQQIMRQTANDPQIGLAQDSAQALQAGKAMPDIGDGSIDVDRSASPFRIVYDEEGTVVESTGQLNGVSPTLPTGIFDYAKAYGENRLTWQPAEHVRLATIVVPYSSEQHSGYVVVARSLSQVEKRTNQLLLLCIVTGVVVAVGSALLVAGGMFAQSKWSAK